MKKIILTFIMLFSVFFIATVEVNADVSLCENAKSAILIEASTNKVLFEKRKDERLGIASMTKVMTLSLTYDAIKNKELSLDDELTTSEHAKSMGGSQVYLEVGEKSKLSDLIKCICIASANDAAVTVAEAVAGSEDAFVEKMNQKAKELGMSNTNYQDATGLTDENHYSSAYDMAIISSYLINTHPEVLEYTSLKESYFRENSDNPFWLVNTNKLLGKDDSIDGLKTGWTNKAGYCISLTGSRDGMRLISVVMGEENPIVRNNEALELIKYGFSNYTIKTFVLENESFGSISSIFCKKNNVSILCPKKIELVILKSEVNKYSVNYVINSKNNNLGYVEINYDGTIILTEELQYEQIEKRNYFELFIEVLRSIFL